MGDTDRTRENRTTDDLEEAKRALEISRMRYFNLYAHAPVAYVTLDRGGVMRDVNVAAADLLGSTVGGLVGTNFLDAVSSEQREELSTHLRTVAETGEPATAELRVRIHGGSHLVLQLMSTPVGAGNDEILTALLDMTEQRRAEQVMIFLDRAAMLFGPMTAPTAIVDQVPLLAVPLLADLCVVELRDPDRPAYVQSAHVDPESAQALHALATSFTSLPGVRDWVERAFSTGQPQVAESFRPSPRLELGELQGGAKVHDLLAVRELKMQSLVVLPLTGRGHVFGVVVLARVTGERRPASDLPIAIELARRAALAIDNGRLFMELHDAIRAKDDFLAVLSHELRTPLTPVLAAVSAALARGVPTGAAAVAMLEMIERNIELERRLIDDLLDLSRVTRGKLELSRQVVDLHRLVDHAVKICRHDADAQAIALSVELDAERHHVDGDPARIEQIVWNLVKNAIKFTERGGSVHVRTICLDDKIRLSVSDTGIGIEPKDVGRIFAPFTQAEAPKGRRLGGMGLGLAITRTIAEAHGGKVFAESPGRGQGATFTVELPAVRPSVTPSSDSHIERAERTAADETPIRVLLVEDDADTLEITSGLLRECHYDVTTADTLAAARERARQSAFDVLVSDINLPDGSGLDLMRELRSSGKPFPGIAMSGYGTREDLDRARRAGFTAHLTKPITFPQLTSAIGKVLRDSRAA
jgi:PAS domain S-box-containing protein